MEIPLYSDTHAHKQTETLPFLLPASFLPKKAMRLIQSNQYISAKYSISQELPILLLVLQVLSA